MPFILKLSALDLEYLSEGLSEKLSNRENRILENKNIQFEIKPKIENRIFFYFSVITTGVAPHGF